MASGEIFKHRPADPAGGANDCYLHERSSAFIQMAWKFTQRRELSQGATDLCGLTPRDTGSFLPTFQTVIFPLDVVHDLPMRESLMDLQVSYEAVITDTPFHQACPNQGWR